MFWYRMLGTGTKWVVPVSRPEKCPVWLGLEISSRGNAVISLIDIFAPPLLPPSTINTSPPPFFFLLPVKERKKERVKSGELSLEVWCVGCEELEREARARGPRFEVSSYFFELYFWIHPWTFRWILSWIFGEFPSFPPIQLEEPLG